MECLHCSSTSVTKNGHRRGKQNYQCQCCSRQLAGQMFEDEYDLALAVIEGVETRGKQKGYSTERFKFNSA
jgi:ribosomal protein L37AE/L43A